MAAPVLKVENLSVALKTKLGWQQVVRGLDFCLHQREILGVVGRSGSGKSVACMSLLGLLPANVKACVEGAVWFEQKNLLGCGETELRCLRGRRISVIFQDAMASLNPALRIETQLLDALLVHQSELSKKDARAAVIESLNEVGFVDPSTVLKAYPFELSGGMLQRVMIAMALLNRPRVLIADEPTTALDVTVQAQILSLLQDLKAKYGFSVVFISHDMAVMAEVADRLLFIDQGVCVESGPTPEVLYRPRHSYTRQLVDAAIAGHKAAQASCRASSTQRVLSVENLDLSFPVRTVSWLGERKVTRQQVLKNVSISIAKGEILGLVGESGSGKSSLARCVMRLLEPDSGAIRIGDTDVSALTGAELRRERHRFQMIFQDTFSSFNPKQTVQAAISEALRISTAAASCEAVSKSLEEVGLNESCLCRYPHQLSGGQRQRVAIARALAMRPQLLVADEPVSAVDAHLHRQIIELLRKLSQKYSLSILFISHDLSVIQQLCHRVAVMEQGCIIESGAVADVFNSPQHSYTQRLLAAIPKLTFKV